LCYLANPFILSDTDSAQSYRASPIAYFAVNDGLLFGEHLRIPTSDLLEMQLGKIGFYTVSPIGARLRKTKVTAKGVSGLLAAPERTEATEGDQLAVDAGPNIITVGRIR
jgi:hypothetical protein